MARLNAEVSTKIFRSINRKTQANQQINNKPLKAVYLSQIYSSLKDCSNHFRSSSSGSFETNSKVISVIKVICLSFLGMFLEQNVRIVKVSPKRRCFPLLLHIPNWFSVDFSLFNKNWCSYSTGWMRCVEKRQRKGDGGRNMVNLKSWLKHSMENVSQAGSKIIKNCRA